MKKPLPSQINPTTPQQQPYANARPFGIGATGIASTGVESSPRPLKRLLSLRLMSRHSSSRSGGPS